MSVTFLNKKNKHEGSADRYKKHMKFIYFGDRPQLLIFLNCYITSSEEANESSKQPDGRQKLYNVSKKCNKI